MKFRRDGGGRGGRTFEGGSKCYKCNRCCTWLHSAALGTWLHLAPSWPRLG